VITIGTDSAQTTEIEKINLKEAIFQTLYRYDTSILEKVPNLKSEDYALLLYLVIGYDLGKGKYFGLTFPLEDNTHLEELRALSNGYVEFRDGVVKMGVIELENLEKILSSIYQAQKYTYFMKSIGQFLQAQANKNARLQAEHFSDEHISPYQNHYDNATSSRSFL
jgi:hypothetical protein